MLKKTLKKELLILYRTLKKALYKKTLKKALRITGGSVLEPMRTDASAGIQRTDEERQIKNRGFCLGR